jgi:hypothetical protein
MVHRRIVGALLGALSLAGILAFTTPLNAGSTYSSAYCGGNYTSGSCYGTFDGWRNSPDPTARFQFTTDVTSTTMQFYAIYNNTMYTCTMPTSAGYSGMRDQSISARGYFYVNWSLGNCSNVQFANGSAY